MNCNPPPTLLLNRPGIQNDKSPYKYLFWLLTLTPPLRRPGALWPWSSCYSHPCGTRAADMPFPIVIESLNNTFRQMWKLSPTQGEESLDFNFAKCIFIHWGAGAPLFFPLREGWVEILLMRVVLLMWFCGGNSTGNMWKMTELPGQRPRETVSTPSSSFL